VSGRTASPDTASVTVPGSEDRTPELRPTPDGSPLLASIRCWTSRASKAPHRTHAVTIDVSWQVTVPHDLESERLAVALGGYLSCLELESHTIPALRHWLALERRDAPPPIRFGDGGDRWHPRSPESCCATAGYDSAAHATEHLRDPRHLAITFGAQRRQLGDLMNAVTAAYAGTGVLTLDPLAASLAAHGLTHGQKDVTSLWYAGIHPRWVLEVRDALGITGRLPARFYLGILLRKTDLSWMGVTLRTAGIDPGDMLPTQHAAGVPLDGPHEESVLSWLTWTHADWDLRDPSARGRFLAAGVSRRIILEIGAAGYDPDDVVRLARGVRRDPDGGARMLAAWIAAGMKPDVDELVALHESGRGPHWYVPARPAINRLREELGPVARGRPDVELALVLAVTGTVPDAAAAYRRGITSWRDDT
jgi:hypothetical protein